MGLHALGDQVVERGALQLVGGGEPVPGRGVLGGEADELVGHRDPRLQEVERAGIVARAAASRSGAHISSISPIWAPLSSAMHTDRFQT